MNEEDLKNQIKQEIKQELKKEKKKTIIILLIIIFVILTIMTIVYIRYDIKRKALFEEGRQQTEQEEREQEEQQEREQIKINIDYYEKSLEYYKSHLTKENTVFSSTARYYIKSEYNDFKKYVENNEEIFIEEERNRANNIIKQYEDTIKEYNIE